MDGIELEIEVVEVECGTELELEEKEGTVGRAVEEVEWEGVKRDWDWDWIDCILFFIVLFVGAVAEVEVDDREEMWVEVVLCEEVGYLVDDFVFVPEERAR